MKYVVQEIDIKHAKDTYQLHKLVFKALAERQLPTQLADQSYRVSAFQVERMLLDCDDHGLSQRLDSMADLLALAELQERSIQLFSPSKNP